MNQNWGWLNQPSGQATERHILEKEPLMDNRFEVTVGAGTMMAGSGTAVRFPHRWTPRRRHGGSRFHRRASASSRGGWLRPQ